MILFGDVFVGRKVLIDKSVKTSHQEEFGCSRRPAMWIGRSPAAREGFQR
jgi:hypothetical protein